jgi:hypothetical protein
MGHFQTKPNNMDKIIELMAREVPDYVASEPLRVRGKVVACSWQAAGDETQTLRICQLGERLELRWCQHCLVTVDRTSVELQGAQGGELSPERQITLKFEMVDGGDLPTTLQEYFPLDFVRRLYGLEPISNPIDQCDPRLFKITTGCGKGLERDLQEMLQRAGALKTKKRLRETF